MNEDLPRSGRTTRQMNTAPPSALYVWKDDALYYPHLLADRLNRQDLIILSPADMLNERYLGRRFSAVILDHAAVLSDRLIARAQTRIYRP